jgi:hypothetical protein
VSGAHEFHDRGEFWVAGDHKVTAIMELRPEVHDRGALCLAGAAKVTAIMEWPGLGEGGGGAF